MNDGEKSVKDTSKKVKPEWDAKKQRHKTWLWRYLGYADATQRDATAFCDSVRLVLGPNEVRHHAAPLIGRGLLAGCNNATASRFH